MLVCTLSVGDMGGGEELGLKMYKICTPIENVSLTFLDGP